MHMKACGNVYICRCGIRLCSLGALKRHCKQFAHEPESLEPKPENALAILADPSAPAWGVATDALPGPCARARRAHPAHAPRPSPAPASTTPLRRAPALAPCPALLACDPYRDAASPLTRARARSVQTWRWWRSRQTSKQELSGAALLC